MFLDKIQKLAEDWQKHPDQLESVAKESLLYGMRLVRNPSPLKKELRKVKISSLIAKPLWSGNAYLLITLPEVLCNRKKKIPCLNDFLYARKILTDSQLKEIRSRVKNICKIPRDKLIKDLIPGVKRSAWSGRFLPQFDGMFENIKDVEQDLIVEALTVVNKEISNFKSNDPGEISKYLSYCADKKAKTYLKQKTPKQLKARLEQAEFDLVVHTHRAEEEQDNCFSNVDIKKDLKKLLSSRVYLGVALFMGFAEQKDKEAFDNYLKLKNIKRAWIAPAQLKLHIEKFLGGPVFQLAESNQTLKKFLLNRIKAEDENDFDSRYAECDEL